MLKREFIAAPDYRQRFLESCDYNWRNTFFIECVQDCRYRGVKPCGDFLFVPEPGGRPMLLTVDDVELLFRQRVDRGDCLGKMSNLLFMELYKKWLAKLPHHSVPNFHTRCPGSQNHSEFCPLLHSIFQQAGKLC